MRGKHIFLLVLIVLAFNEIHAKNNSSTPKLRRSDFPEDFVFGSATSAYQIEGAAHEDGRGPSIWDTFSEKYPEKIKDGSNGSVAADSYHLTRLQEDVALLHQIGFNAYRFSISWSRILPRGNLKGGINQAGIDYYNNLINELLSKVFYTCSKMLKGSSDFIGINYYSSAYAKDVPCPTEYVTLFSDPCASVTGEREGVPIGPKAGSDWLLIYPKGIRDLILYAKYKFKDPVIYITENGRDEIDTGKRFLKDGDRIDFYARHLEMVKDAISIGANMKGFFAWSLLDNFEWAAGYTARFGIVYVDFKDGCKRYPKKSADWFKKFLNPKKSN